MFQSPPMARTKHRGGRWGRLIVGAILLTLISGSYLHPPAPTTWDCWERHVRGGFPIAFVCDHTHSSPTSSWGQIDLADWVFALNKQGQNILLWGGLLNIGFYMALLGGIGLAVPAIRRRGGLTKPQFQPDQHRSEQ